MVVEVFAEGAVAAVAGWLALPAFDPSENSEAVSVGIWVVSSSLVVAAVAAAAAVVVNCTVAGVALAFTGTAVCPFGAGSLDKSPPSCWSTSWKLADESDSAVGLWELVFAVAAAIGKKVAVPEVVIMGNSHFNCWQSLSALPQVGSNRVGGPKARAQS